MRIGHRADKNQVRALSGRQFGYSSAVPSATCKRSGTFECGVASADCGIQAGITNIDHEPDVENRSSLHILHLSGYAVRKGLPCETRLSRPAAAAGAAPD